MNPLPRLTLLLAAAAFLASNGPLQASGFQLREQSPSAQGNAFAGVSARGFDIGSMYFNPATLTAFDGFQVVTGLSFVAPVAELSGATATRATLGGPLAPFGGTTIAGAASHGDAANNAILPNLYAMWSVSKDFKLGLSVNAPFGLVTDYDADFIGRYHALKSDLKTVDVAVNAAYRVHPKFSVGASLVYRTVEAELSNAVDMGQIAFLGLASSTNPVYPSSLWLPFSPTAATFDGKATIQGDTHVLGYKAGLTFQPTEAFTLGLSYHGATKPKVEGTVTYRYPTDVPVASQPYFNAVVNGAHLVDGGATAEVELPDTLSLGLAWDVTPTLALALEASRTGWSSFKELRVAFDSGQADSVTHENWRDTWYCALGATWKLSEALSLRAGVATDQGAVKEVNRTPRIPDGDRTWFSTGLGYRLSDRLTFDVAYTHILVKDGKLALQADTPGNPDFFRGDLTGTYRNRINILAASLRMSF